MSYIEIKVPALGESITEATIAKWLKSEGEVVEKDEVITISVPIEIVGIFTKPFALMIRLFANITAGHIVILALISLIFINKHEAWGALSVPMALFISVLELLVAALQAYLFALLSALFIGAAVEEAHH